MPLGPHHAAEANETMGRARDVIAPEYSFKSKPNWDFPPFPNPSKNPNEHRQFKEQLGYRFGCRVPVHHDIASPYIKNSPSDLLELHTEPPIPLQAAAAEVIQSRSSLVVWTGTTTQAS
jgi:hypothetical protein